MSEPEYGNSTERWMVVAKDRTPVETDLGRTEADHLAARYTEDNPYPLLSPPFRVERDLVAEDT